MIALTGTSFLEALMVGAEATTNPTFYASYAIADAQEDFKGIVPASGSLTGVTPAALVAAPGGGNLRHDIKDVTIFNADTQPNTIIVRVDVGGSKFNFVRATVPVNGSLRLENGKGGWAVYDAAGLVVVNNGSMDHGDLGGLGDDDHAQYSLADGSRAFTGEVAGIAPTVAASLVTKGYADGLLLFGQDYQHATTEARTTTTSATPQNKTTLTTPVLTGTYRVAWSAIVDNGGAVGDFRLRNTTDAVTIDGTVKFKSSDSAERVQVGGFAEVVFAGSPKTFVIQFNDDAGGNTQGIKQARIEIWKVGP